MRSSASFAVLLFASAILCAAQTVETAKTVYGSAQESVFLIYLNDSAGTAHALGSAFLVAPRKLITNAHVADAGNPVMAVGPVRIPLKVIRTDEKNDLAILSADVDLTSKPLPLAGAGVTPGDRVFAIGNPEGLEKTISEGIVSGLRIRDNTNLLQITTPISHGSSGGPILNSRGEVVGVAVGMLEDGQNLNFAVPVQYVKAIMEAKDASPSKLSDVKQNLDSARALLLKRKDLDYSDQPDSEFQKNDKEIQLLMASIVDVSSSQEVLSEIACMGTKGPPLFSDTGIRAAKKLVRTAPTPGNRALLAYVLYDRGQDESFNAILAAKDSPEMATATAAYKDYFAQANAEASAIQNTARGSALLLADYVIGSVRNDSGETTDAIRFHSAVANGNIDMCGTDLSQQAFSSLIQENVSASKPEEAEKWFRQYAQRYSPSAYEWDAEGDRRSVASDNRNAADAYERAAGLGDYYEYDYCYAANEFFFMNGSEDKVLELGRKCIEASVKHLHKSSDKYFDKALPFTYQHMASVLNDRGVYQPAFDYIKESLARDPENAFSLSTEAEILANLERYSECVSASQAAIRKSDGKYPSMQFRLGYCYFQLQDWSKAATSFRVAADADKTDAVSAFNLGLSLERQGYGADAQQWYREALTRNPSSELRAKIKNSLR